MIHLMVFGLFKKKLKHVDEPDEVYMSRTRADAALVEAARTCGRPVVVASFFSESLERIAAKLNAAGVGTRALSAGGEGSGAGESAVWLLDASEVASNYAFDGWLRRVDCELSFYFVEHYPVLRAEQAVIDVLEEASAARTQRVRFFVGLDEPLMRVFAGDRVVSLMERLGMSADEAISHPWVDKSIVNAQKKLSKRIPNAVPAPSAEQWFRVNLGWQAPEKA
jgi:hypothetical protein